MEKYRDRIVVRFGCWEWRGAKDRHGYGRIRKGGRSGPTTGAHRVIYEHFYGAIPDGLELDHLCRNPGCVRPSHLEPVTHAENMRRGEPWNRGLARCKRGHDLTPDNVRVETSGSRRCLACDRERARRRPRRHRAKEPA